MKSLRRSITGRIRRSWTVWVNSWILLQNNPASNLQGRVVSECSNESGFIEKRDSVCHDDNSLGSAELAPDKSRNRTSGFGKSWSIAASPVTTSLEWSVAQ